MTASWYIKQVLDGQLKEFYKDMKHERRGVVFQQDNASSHRAKKTKRWFEKASIPHLFHPANSPNLNAIEPVWHELKKRLRALPHPPTTYDSLCDVILQVWEDLPFENVDKHIARGPDHVQAVLAARGGHTKY